MQTWEIVLIAVFSVIGFLAFVFVCWGIAIYNKLVKGGVGVDESFSTMDVYMKKRHDLIPNYVETVRAYAKHENETLEGVMKARYSAMNAATTAEKIKGETALTRTLGRLYKVTENYPELRSNQNFLHLQGKLSELENEIAQSRKYYNACVKDYNKIVLMFPSNLIAKMFKFECLNYFELENVEERAVPKVQF